MEIPDDSSARSRHNTCGIVRCVARQYVCETARTAFQLVDASGRIGRAKDSIVKPCGSLGPRIHDGGASARRRTAAQKRRWPKAHTLRTSCLVESYRVQPPCMHSLSYVISWAVRGSPPPTSSVRNPLSLLSLPYKCSSSCPSIIITSLRFSVLRFT